MADKKTFRGRMELKADGEGQPGAFRAEFATLGVIDHDQDVTEPGAFQAQETLIEAWNHNYGVLPVGKGVISEEKDKAIVEGAFFMDTESGLEHYKVVKALGPLQEWSYTFEILDSGYGKFEDQDVRFLRKLDVWGVAPVTRGAGIDTRTVDIKRGARGRGDPAPTGKSALASHSTGTTDAAWDGPANEARARSDEDAAYYGKIYAWRDPEGDPGVKSTYKFVHHMVAEGGEPGAANVPGCTTGIGVLNGGRGGTTIPDADRQGVWDHLARHIRDADLEPPELKGAEIASIHRAVDELMSVASGLKQRLDDLDADGGEGGPEGQGDPDGDVELSGELSADPTVVELEILRLG